MTIGLLILIGIPALIIVLTLVGWTQYIRAEMRHHGHIPVMWRWFSGALPHSVRNEHDRRYRAQYDPSSQHYHIKARLHRAVVRTCFTFGIPLLPIAFLLAAVHGPPYATYILVAIAGALASEVIWRIWKAEKVRKNRITMKHVGRAAAPFANQPVRGRTSQWIRFVDDKRQEIRVDLPKNWNPSEQNRARLKQVVTETVGFHPGSEDDWQLEGKDSHVIFKNRKDAPPHVELADIQRYIDANGEDRVTLGLGRGNEPVSASLKEDSPNFGMSVGAGGGKSQLARLIAAQVLHNGGNVLILDPKQISHAWAKNLPNVRYARTTEEIHKALLWLDYEIKRRSDVANSGHDVEGEVLANVGKRLLVLAEELNEMTQRLRIYWGENRGPKDPKKSPAISALESALFMGRQLKTNTVAVAQMMTALAAGSGAARENMGVRILGRYTRNNWRMLVPEFDMPGRSMRPGRMMVVTHKVTECQVAFLTGAEARELATSGMISEFPRDPVNDPEPVAPVEGEVIEGEIVDSENPALTSGDNNLKVDLEIKPRQKVTLSEAAGKCVQRTLKALQMSRDRDPEFPEHCGVRWNVQGRPKEYWADEIIAWDQKRRGNQNV